MREPGGYTGLLGKTLYEIPMNSGGTCFFLLRAKNASFRNLPLHLVTKEKIQSFGDRSGGVNDRAFQRMRLQEK